jgi:hypothetical protein
MTPEPNVDTLHSSVKADFAILSTSLFVSKKIFNLRLDRLPDSSGIFG